VAVGVVLPEVGTSDSLFFAGCFLRGDARIVFALSTVVLRPLVLKFLCFLGVVVEGQSFYCVVAANKSFANGIRNMTMKIKIGISNLRKQQLTTSNKVRAKQLGTIAKKRLNPRLGGLEY
jgi:hypothetical protein